MRIFCAIQNWNWELPNLILPLKDLGHDVILYDWKIEGFDQYDKDWDEAEGGKYEMNLKLVDLVKQKNKIKKINLFFSYLSDPVIKPWVITEISLLGIPTLNFSCNDIFGFERGHSKTSPIFDLNWTTHKAALPNYKSVGAKAVCIPHGINPKFYKLESKQIPQFTYDVSFVGQLYGYRGEFLSQLVNQRLSYGILGKISFPRMLQTYLETKINVNFSGAPGANFNSNNKFLRLRDFEVIATGGLYMTERCNFIQELYEEDKEIIFYDSVEEFIDKVKFYSNDKNRTKAKEIAKAGQRKCLSEYNCEKIFERVFKELGL